MQLPQLQLCGSGLLAILLSICSCLLRGDMIGNGCNPLYAYIFASSACPECMEVKRGLLPRMLEIFGKRVEFQDLRLDGIENFKLLLLYEEYYGVTDNESLKIFVGDGLRSGR